jgi:beta-hydroxylase
VDGIPAFWRDEEAILFDETFHTAQNLTDRPRFILFCDLERKIWPFVATLFNRSV